MFVKKDWNWSLNLLAYKGIYIESKSEQDKQTYRIFLQVGYEPDPCKDVEIHNFEGNKEKAEERLNELIQQANSVVRP